MDTAGNERRFAFRGGLACLDFVNTLAWAASDSPVDYLGSYPDLMDWARQADLLTLDERDVLATRAVAMSEAAGEVLARAVALREAIRCVLSASIEGEAVEEAALAGLNRELSRSLSRLQVGQAPPGALGWQWHRQGNGGIALDYPLWPVARSAAELLVSPRIDRVKVCQGPGCGWMFVDESRNGSRRWCDSRDCGNRERVRRHLARKRAGRS